MIRLVAALAIGVGLLLSGISIAAAGGPTRTKAECRALGGVTTRYFKEYNTFWCETKSKDRQCAKALKVKAAFYDVRKKKCVKLNDDDDDWMEAL